MLNKDDVKIKLQRVKNCHNYNNLTIAELDLFIRIDCVDHKFAC